MITLYIYKCVWGRDIRQEEVSKVKGKAIRSRFKKRNNLVIIIDGEDAEELKEQLLLEVRKISRKKELGYYITPAENVSLNMVQEFANFSLQISAVNRG